MVALKVHRFGLTGSTGGPALKVHRFGLTGPVVTRPALRVHRFGLAGPVAVALESIANMTVEPGKLVQITAVLTGGGTADSYTFRRVSGTAPVTLSNAGAVCKFVAPGLLSGNAPVSVTLVLGVTATVAGVTSAERQFTVTVRPEIQWSRVHLGQWQPASRS